VIDGGGLGPALSNLATLETNEAAIAMGSTDANWIRMRFKKNKVWVEADADGRPLQKEGRVRIKYQLDQPHEYRVAPQSLRGLDAPPPQTPGPLTRRPRERVASAAGPAEGGTVHIYTDGASSGNPGPSGIGVVLTCDGKRKEISEYLGVATNNIAELTAIQRGLAAVRNRRLPVRVYTDSSYAYGVLVLNWKPKKNLDLITAIRRSMSAFPRLTLVKVPGHKGVVENERADELATAAVRSAVGN
jgi:ribonuclease HI